MKRFPSPKSPAALRAPLGEFKPENVPQGKLPETAFKRKRLAAQVYQDNGSFENAPSPNKPRKPTY